MQINVFVKAWILLLVLQGCNTLYNFRMIDIEIKKPAKFSYSNHHRILAVRYNNSNVSYNPLFARHFINSEIAVDTLNSDSTASEIYFSCFLENLKPNDFFDKMIILNKGELSGYNYILPDGKMIAEKTIPGDSNLMVIRSNVPTSLNHMLVEYPVMLKNRDRTITLDPDLGLYNSTELQHIADSTGADLLLSLDYFASFDGVTTLTEWQRGMITVQNMALWNFYDLKTGKSLLFYNHLDTISWNSEGYTRNELLKNLPPRRDAIMNAAEISGLNFADYLVPHWEKTERLYYRSGHLDLKKTDVLIKEGKWMEAAVIWKANVDNPNKKIAAKSMFNLAIACEMAGDIDAAIDWTVKSFYLFEQKNEIHALNCMDYLQILAQRKQEIKKITQIRNVSDQENQNGFY